MPWANGRGVTTELVSFARSRALSALSLPAWRLSIAGLDGPAGFSPLPGTRRVFLPVGTDVTLVVNGIERQVPDRMATSFDGDDIVELVGMHRRLAHAVNLMYRAGTHGTVPGLTVGRSDEASARTCLVAVALESCSSTAMFDACTMDDGGPPEAGIQMAMVTIAGS